MAGLISIKMYLSISLCFFFLSNRTVKIVSLCHEHGHWWGCQDGAPAQEEMEVSNKTLMTGKLLSILQGCACVRVTHSPSGSKVPAVMDT